MADTSTVLTPDEIPDEQLESNLTGVGMNKGISIDKIYYYRSRKGLTMQEIADLLGCTKETVWYHIHRHNIPTPEQVKDWGGVQAIKLKSKADLIMENLTEDKLKKARLTELTTGYGTLFDKIQLLEGKATERIDITSLDISLEDIRKQKEILLNGES